MHAYLTFAALLYLQLALVVSSALGEDSLERDYAEELPRIAPIEPGDAMASFTVKSGFRMDLVASEPLVRDPVAMAFDADGRCYVVEMTGYSEQRVENPGTVRLLEDTDSDGIYDKGTVFLDGLPWAVAAACWDGGVFVGAPPDILYAKDTDGDGVADLREVVFTGFNYTNVQGMMNTFIWGLDNRIHAAASSSGGKARPAGAPETEGLSIGGRDFSFDPRTRTLRAESGGAQHGQSFDDQGRKFVCHNSDHLQWVWYADSDAARNPWYSPPSPRESIAVDGPAAEVYRLSPVEPWREVRTRLRLKGLVPGPIEGGGRAAGYFTSATGVTVYRGDAWPEEYRGQVFIADVGSNLIHRKKLIAEGLDLKGIRLDEGAEFIASTDIWFRPVQFANAPDGCLYVADMYREVIEHPDSLPPIIKQHLDLTSGNDRGRLYRIAPDGFVPPPLPRLSAYATAELVPLLAHANAWHHETAARLIYERQDTSVVSLLETMATEHENPLARMRARYVLDGLNALGANTLAAGLRDPSAIVREHALRLGAGHVVMHEVRAGMLALANDEDPWVRLQAAWSLGAVSSDERLPALAALAQRDAASPRVRTAVLASSSDLAGRLASLLAADAAFVAAAEAGDWLPELARIAGKSRMGGEIAAVLNAVNAAWTGNQSVAEAMLLALAESAPEAARGASGMLGTLVHEAARTATDTGAAPEQRADAIRILGNAPVEEALPIYKALLESAAPDPVLAAAIEGMGRVPGAAAARALLRAWPGLSPARKAQAMELLFRRAESLRVLLFAIESGDIALAELDSTRRHQLAGHEDEKIRVHATRLMENLQPAGRDEVVARYAEALSLTGDATRGREVFVKNCMPCHHLHGVGSDVGPNLATMAQAGAEKILVNVLDPNRELNPQYANYTVRTKAGEIRTGILASETATSITLKRAYGETDVIARSDVAEMRSSALSIMPEGLESTINPQGMADLIAFVLAGPETSTP